MKRDRCYRQKELWGRHFFTCILSMTALLLVSCSERKVPPPPKHHPELLLEVLEKGAANDYIQLLPRVKKLRALEASSEFLPELEEAVSLNMLVKEINQAAVRADFARALKLAERYEMIHGPGKETAKVKGLLRNLTELDQALAALTRPSRSAASLAAELDKLEKLNKKMKLSPKIRNFLQNKRSQLKRLKKLEYRRMLFGLWSDVDFLVRTGVSDGAQALAAVLASEAQTGGPAYLFSFPDVRKDMVIPAFTGSSLLP